MKWSKNVYTFLGCEAEYDESPIALFGAPVDSTTSMRPGTRFASSAMRSDMVGLETYSPLQERDLCDYKIFDAGDLELPFGDSAAALAMIEERADRILSDGKLPVMLGGEHLVTLGAVRAAVRHHPDLCIVHFDAHADLRDELMGVHLSHATVMRRCWELTGDGRIFQFGIRSGDREEFRWAKGHVTTQLHKIDGVAAVLPQLAGKPVYLTIDLDVLDPGFFPGTGTPEAGGVSFYELVEAIRTLMPLRIVGCDLVELSPPLDPSGVSTAMACKVLRELLLALCGREA